MVDNIKSLLEINVLLHCKTHLKFHFHFEFKVSIEVYYY